MKMKPMNYYLLAMLLCALFSCADKTQEGNASEDKNGWVVEQRLTKTVDNLSFTFPSEGHAYEHRDFLVNACFEALKGNSDRIKVPEYTQPIKFIFLNSRAEMEKEVGYAATGWTNTWTQEIHIVANNEFTPPIKHEVLHMISMTSWGYPHSDLIWLNEGLATTTQEYCNGYTLGEIYRYFLEEEKLLSMESLTRNFHEQPSIISYHQSAHLVEYLIKEYGLEKLEELWKKGFSSFEEIYSVSFSQMEEEVKKETMKAFPVPVNIDWEVFQNGCF